MLMSMIQRACTQILLILLGISILGFFAMIGLLVHEWWTVNRKP